MSATKTKKPSANGKPKRPPRAKQQTIDDWGPQQIPELDKLAESYHTAKLERMRLSEEESDAATLLEAGMKRHGVTYYEWDGKFARIGTTTKVQTGKKKEPKPERNGHAEVNGDGE